MLEFLSAVTLPIVPQPALQLAGSDLPQLLQQQQLQPQLRVLDFPIVLQLPVSTQQLSGTDTAIAPTGTPVVLPAQEIYRCVCTGEHNSPCTTGLLAQQLELLGVLAQTVCPRPPKLLFLALNRSPEGAGKAGKDRQPVAICSTLSTLGGALYQHCVTLCHSGANRIKGHVVAYCVGDGNKWYEL